MTLFLIFAAALLWLIGVVLVYALALDLVRSRLERKASRPPLDLCGVRSLRDWKESEDQRFGLENPDRVRRAR